MEKLEGADFNQEDCTFYEDIKDENDVTLDTNRSKTLAQNLQDLPDEIILKVLSYSEPKDLIRSRQVSKRLRKISNDNSLWQNVHLVGKMVKAKFLELILNKECKNLTLSNTIILGSLRLGQMSQLRALYLKDWVFKRAGMHIKVLEEILASCYSLQVLEMPESQITPRIAASICQNGNTLQILDLNDSTGDQSTFTQIIKSCQELKEVNLADVIENNYYDLSDDCLEFIAKHICPNIEKLDISALRFVDNHFKILLSRCNKIKELILRSVELTNNSLPIIRENLSLTLEKLSLDYSDDLSLIGCLELKSMPRLKFLFFHDDRDGEDEDRDEAIENLRKQLPHLRIKCLFGTQ